MGDMSNVPHSALGSNPLFKDMLLAGYFASISNHCEYCTCHAVAIANSKDSLLRDRMIFHSERGGQSPSDKALIDCALALGRFPADLSDDQLLRMKRYYTEEEVEWIVLCLSFLGSANFISSAFGIELEKGALRLAEFPLATTGWNPGKHTPEGFEMPQPMDHTNGDNNSNNFKLSKDVHKKIMPIMKALKKCPRAMVQTIMLEAQYKSKVPASSRKASIYLLEKTGYSFPLLKNFSKFRGVTQCLAAVLRDQFDPSLTKIGLTTKSLCQLIFAGHMDDEHLQEDACNMVKVFAKKEGLSDAMDTDKIIEDTLDLSRESVPTTKEGCREMLKRIEDVPGIASQKVAAVLILSRAAANKPTSIEPIIVSEVANLLSPAEITETLFWLSIQIIFHRIFRFHEVKNNTPAESWDDSKIISRKLVIAPTTTKNNSVNSLEPRLKKQRISLRRRMSIALSWRRSSSKWSKKSASLLL